MLASVRPLYCVWQYLCWRCWIERSLAAVFLFKMAACPEWLLCTVGKALMASFHLDCSDRGLYRFLPRWNYYGHKRASFSFFPSFFIKHVHSCCLPLCESMKMSYDWFSHSRADYNGKYHHKWLFTIISDTRSHMKSFPHTILVSSVLLSNFKVIIK